MPVDLFTSLTRLSSGANCQFRKAGFEMKDDVAVLVDPVLVVSVNLSFPQRSAYDAARYAWPRTYRGQNFAVGA